MALDLQAIPDPEHVNAGNQAGVDMEAVRADVARRQANPAPIDTSPAVFAQRMPGPRDPLNVGVEALARGRNPAHAMDVALKASPQPQPQSTPVKLDLQPLDLKPLPEPKGAAATFIDKMGEHIGVPFTDYDLKHAADAIDRGLNSVLGTKIDIGNEEQDQASEAAHPLAATAGSITGATIGLGGASAALGAAKNAVQFASASRKLSALQAQAAAINAAQDAAHIKAVAEAVSQGTRTTDELMPGLRQFLKEDAQAEWQSGRTANGVPGGPQWNIPGSVPKAPVDVTPADLAKQAAEDAANKTTKSLLKDPRTLSAILGAGTLAAGGGVWHVMSTTWHARQLIRNLQHIFGE